jgi:hypothetical protein
LLGDLHEGQAAFCWGLGGGVRETESLWLVVQSFGAPKGPG